MINQKHPIVICLAQQFNWCAKSLSLSLTFRSLAAFWPSRSYEFIIRVARAVRPHAYIYHSSYSATRATYDPESEFHALSVPIFLHTSTQSGPVAWYLHLSLVNVRFRVSSSDTEVAEVAVKPNAEPARIIQLRDLIRGRHTPYPHARFLSSPIISPTVF